MLQDALLQLIFGSQYCRPVSGRVVIRASNECESAVVGIVHLPNGFQVQEGAAYLASFLHGQCAIGATAIDSGLPDELAGQGVDNVLRGECWYPTSVEGTAIIRFFQAFPETNSWIMFGVSRQRLIMPNLLSNTGHAWFDLCSGEMSQIAAPGDEVGLTHGQLLSTLLVWPDANGAFFVLPAIESTWREVYYNLSLLNAELGAGNITLDEYFSRFNADKRFGKISIGRVDEEYCHYLAHLKAIGGLCVQKPLTPLEVKQRDEMARQALEQSLGLSSH